MLSHACKQWRIQVRLTFVELCDNNIVAKLAGRCFLGTVYKPEYIVRVVLDPYTQHAYALAAPPAHKFVRAPHHKRLPGPLDGAYGAYDEVVQKTSLCSYRPRCVDSCCGGTREPRRPAATVARPPSPPWYSPSRSGCVKSCCDPTELSDPANPTSPGDPELEEALRELEREWAAQASAESAVSLGPVSGLPPTQPWPCPLGRGGGGMRLRPDSAANAPKRPRIDGFNSDSDEDMPDAQDPPGLHADESEEEWLDEIQPRRRAPMQYCTDPTHPQPRGGGRRRLADCYLCNPNAFCLDPAHPQLPSGHRRWRACIACNPDAFCPDASHPRRATGGAFRWTDCPLCNPDSFCQDTSHPQPANGTWRRTEDCPPM